MKVKYFVSNLFIALNGFPKLSSTQWLIKENPSRSGYDVEEILPHALEKQEPIKVERARVAQLVERTTDNRVVGSSNLSSCTNAGLAHVGRAPPL